MTDNLGFFGSDLVKFHKVKRGQFWPNQAKNWKIRILGYSLDMKILKVLDKYHMKGSFFISSELIGKAGYLDRKQILDISRKGHEICSHGQTHQKLIKMDKKHLLSALVTSKAEIEEQIGEKIFGFSYPLLR